MEPTAIDPTGSAASYSVAEQVLGKDDFLRLLVAKLGNQDPLKPADDTEFVAQLATFSSLEQLISVNKNLENLASAQNQLINAQALTLIGKDALVASPGSMTVRNGVPDQMVYAMPRAAGEATLKLIGPDGTTVRTFQLETTPSGSVTIDWDGTDQDGDPVPDGDYRIEVEAKDTQGEPMDVPVFLSVSIDAVHFRDGAVSLISGDREIPFEAILEIRAGRG